MKIVRLKKSHREYLQPLMDKDIFLYESFQDYLLRVEETIKSLVAIKKEGSNSIYHLFDLIDYQKGGIKDSIEITQDMFQTKIEHMLSTYLKEE
jgi:hypothetical protein